MLVRCGRWRIAASPFGSKARVSTCASASPRRAAAMGKRDVSHWKGEEEGSSPLRRISAGLATALSKFRRSNVQSSSQPTLVRGCTSARGRDGVAHDVDADAWKTRRCDGNACGDVEPQEGADVDADGRMTPNKRPSSASDSSLITSSSRKKKKEQSAIRLASPLSKVTRADEEREGTEVARNLTQEFENDENTPGADNEREDEGLERQSSKSTLLAFFSPMYSLFKGGMPRPGHDTAVAEVTATLEHQPEYHVHELDNPSLACEEESELEEEYEYELFDPYFFIKNLPPLHQCVCSSRPLLLPKKTRRCPPHTLVLDLDETLVHSTLDGCAEDADFSFPVEFNCQEIMIHVKCRPGVLEFLETVSKHFEVVIFTASQQVYAEALLDILDRDRKFIKHRIYRDSCVYVEGNYMKDLSVLGRDLSKVVIVDNSPQAFGFQLANGIPIESWFDDRRDRELKELLPFLLNIVKEDDVRPLIEQRFRLHELVRRAREPRA